MEILKAIMLSNEWEISFNNFQKIIDEIKKLKESYKNNDPVLQLFKIMESLSKYLLKHKTDSHPEVFKTIDITYQNLEKLISTPKINKQEQDKIISESIKNFKKLKTLITPKKSNKTSDEVIKAVVERINIYVKKEITLLIQELKA